MWVNYPKTKWRVGPLAKPATDRKEGRSEARAGGCTRGAEFVAEELQLPGSPRKPRTSGPSGSLAISRPRSRQRGPAAARASPPQVFRSLEPASPNHCLRRRLKELARRHPPTKARALGFPLRGHARDAIRFPESDPAAFLRRLQFGCSSPAIPGPRPEPSQQPLQEAIEVGLLAAAWHLP